MILALFLGLSLRGLTFEGDLIRMDFLLANNWAYIQGDLLSRGFILEILRYLDEISIVISSAHFLENDFKDTPYNNLTFVML